MDYVNALIHLKVKIVLFKSVKITVIFKELV